MMASIHGYPVLHSSHACMHALSEKHVFPDLAAASCLCGVRLARHSVICIGAVDRRRGLRDERLLQAVRRLSHACMHALSEKHGFPDLVAASCLCGVRLARHSVICIGAVA